MQIDHVCGEGNKDNQTNRTAYYRRVIEQAESGKYQLLCANCNWIKRAVRGETT